MSATFTGNDVTNSKNDQQIELSQLGIVKENVADRFNEENDIKEISYLNTGTHDFSSSNFLVNLPPEGIVGSTNKLDNTEVVESNNFVPDVNKNAYIFEDELSPPDFSKPIQQGNKIFNLQNEINEPKESKFPTQFPLTSTNSTESVSNRNTFNQFELSLSDNVFDSEISKGDIVKPFPFGQIQGNTKPTNTKNKRVPTLEIKSNFVDNSRKPILRVQSKFVDMSGRQNPKMETIGSFVDTSKSKQLQPTTDNTLMQTTTEVNPTTKTTLKSTMKQYTTVPSPTKSANPVSVNPPLQGVTSTDTRQVMTNDISNTESNSNMMDSKRDNPATFKRNEDKLKVDILYPPAPFPAFDQASSISGVDQKQSDAQEQLVTKSNTQIDSTENNVNNANTAPGTNAIEQTPLDLDYDLYADGNEQSQISSQGLSETSIPLDTKHNDDHDRFVTDPNVQIINPNNQVVHADKPLINQNGIESDTLSQGSVNNNFHNNFVNSATSGVLSSNENIVPGISNQNSQNRQFGNGNFIQNNQINRNRLMNPSLQGSTTESGSQTNTRINPSILRNNGNVINQNTFNQNIGPGFRQNMDNTPSNRFNSVQNRFSNQKNSMNSGQNNFIPNPKQQINRLQSGQLSAGQINVNKVQNSVQTATAKLPDARSNTGNTLDNEADLNNRLNSPINSMNNNLISRNAFINRNANGDFNTQNNFIEQNVNLKNAGTEPNNQNSAINTQNTIVNPNLNQINAQTIQNNVANPIVNQNVLRNIQNNAANPIVNQNHLINTQNNAANPNLNQNFIRNMGNNVDPNINQNSARNSRNNAANGMIGSRVPTEIMGTRPVNSNLLSSQGRVFLNQGMTKTGNVNFGNQMSRQVGLNRINSQVIRTPLTGNNGNFGQNDFNFVNRNVQNRPLVSGNNNVQLPNSFQNNQNNFQRNVNGLASNIRSPQNLAQIFQNQNDFLGRPNSFLNSGNGMQRFGQNNGNVLQNRQNTGIFPNSLTNLQPNFQGNMPQFQNNLPINMLNRNLQNVENNFRQNPSANAISNMGVNAFPNNGQFNSNPTNVINPQFWTFR